MWFPRSRTTYMSVPPSARRQLFHVSGTIKVFPRNGNLGATSEEIAYRRFRTFIFPPTTLLPPSLRAYRRMYSKLLPIRGSFHARKWSLATVSKAFDLPAIMYLKLTRASIEWSLETKRFVEMHRWFLPPYQFSSRQFLDTRGHVYTHTYIHTHTYDTEL